MSSTPLRILFAAANPRDTEPLRLAEEMREIEGKLRSSQHRASFDLRSAWAVRADDLLQHMHEVRPNVLHISGHGATTGEIVLEDAGGAARAVAPEALQALFESFGQWLQIVVLNACYSGKQAAALAQTIDVVVGMNNSVGDRAAIVFAASFYRALGFGMSVGAAFTQGIVALKLEGIPEHPIPELLTRDGVDASKLTLVGEHSSAAASRRARDPAVPEPLRRLLANGTELIALPEKGAPAQSGPADESRLIFLALGMRHSEVNYVIEADQTLNVGYAAEQLAWRILPRSQAAEYEWTLESGGRKLKDWLTLETAGLRTGDEVLLTGNHRHPQWSPSRL